MKRYLPAVLLLVLFGLAIFQTTKIVKASRSLSRTYPAEKQYATYMEQQQWLFDAALAARHEDPLLAPALQKLTDIQQRYSKSALVSLDRISIVDIPEPMFIEHLKYSWRIHVPENRTVEVFGYFAREASVEDVDSPEFSVSLMPGESKVAIEFRGPYSDLWGNTLPVEQRFKQYDGLVEARVNDELVWTKKGTPSIYVKRPPFKIPTVILDSEPLVETFYGSGLHIQLRVVETRGDSQ